VSVDDLQRRLGEQHYVADRALSVSLVLSLKLQRPLFLEGEAGVGKTSLAAAVAGALGRDLIRLQCYEGLDITHAAYEWDYARQLLELRIIDAVFATRLTRITMELRSPKPDAAMTAVSQAVSVNGDGNLDHKAATLAASAACVY